MTPSSTPGTSPAPDDDHGDQHGDAAPWPDTGQGGDPGATRPLPPVSRLPAGAPHPGAPGTGAWYDDEHTRPLPAVPAQRAPAEDPWPRADPTPVSAGATGHAGPVAPTGPAHPAVAGDPAARHARRREAFGGLQLVPGFFGWLSALALMWLLLALAGLLAPALGLSLGQGMGGVVDELASGATTAWPGALVLGAAELLAFVGGGYAAARMARFSGARQGVSVWLWSLLARSAATVAGLVWADTVGLTPVGVSAQALIGDQLGPGLLAVAAVLVVDLLGAVLGGLWGIRYHRRVDRWEDTGR